MDMNKQAKAKTTFDNIIIYVHEPTAPPSFLDVNMLEGKKPNYRLLCFTIIQSKNKILIWLMDFCIGTQKKLSDPVNSTS